MKLFLKENLQTRQQKHYGVTVVYNRTVGNNFLQTLSEDEDEQKKYAGKNAVPKNTEWESRRKK